jgi:membrane protein DedA with SNARE-associated domain
LIEQFITTYGYYAVFAFACIEGEVAILTAGFLCERGLMSLPIVILCAFFGTLLTEQGLFFVGRVYGIKLLEQYPKLRKNAEKAIAFLKKYDAAFIFGSRFVYGIRNISPIVIGMAEITPLKFSSLNIPAAFFWSIIVAGIGYGCADILDTAKSNVKYVQIALLLILCAAPCYLLFVRKGKGENKG